MACMFPFPLTRRFQDTAVHNLGLIRTLQCSALNFSADLKGLSLREKNLLETIQQNAPLPA